MVLGGALGPGLVARDDIHRRFTWQAWRNVISTVVLRGRHGTHGTGWRPGLVARDAAALCVAGVALADIHIRFTWQVWHHLTSTVVLLGRRGNHGTPRPPLPPAARMSRTQHNFVTHHLSNTTFTHNFVNQHLSHTFFHAQLSHTTLSHTIFHTPSFTHHFVTHRLSTLLDTPRLPPATRMSHTTQLCHTPSFTHNFHTQLCQPASFTDLLSHTTFTHKFVTHHLSHTLFHTLFCHTPSLTHHL